MLESHEAEISLYSKRRLRWIAIFTLCVGFYFIYEGLSKHSEWGERGTYGDFIGGTAGIFLEILTIIVILYAQIDTNDNNRQILKVSNRQGDLQFLSFYLQEIKSLSEKAFPELKSQIEDPFRELEWIYYSLISTPDYGPNSKRLEKLFGTSGAFGESFSKNIPKRMSIKSLLTAVGDLISWDRTSERKRFNGLYHSSYGTTIEAVVPQESIFMLIFLWYASLPKLDLGAGEQLNIWQILKRRYFDQELCYETDIKISKSILKKVLVSDSKLSLLFSEALLEKNSLGILAVFKEDPLDNLSITIYEDFLENTLQKNVYECAHNFSQSIVHLFALNSRIGFYKSIEKYCLRNDYKIQEEHLQCFFGGIWQRFNKLVTFDEKLAMSENMKSPPEIILVSSFSSLIRESLISIKTGILKILDHSDEEWFEDENGEKLFSLPQEPNSKEPKKLQKIIRQFDKNYLRLRNSYIHVTALILSDLISSLDAQEYRDFHIHSKENLIPILQKPFGVNPNCIDENFSEEYKDYLKNSVISSLNEEIYEEISPLLKKLNRRHIFLKENSLYPYNHIS